MKKTILMMIIGVLFLGAGIVYYLYNKPHRNVESEEADILISSVQLFQNYSENEKKADSLYLNRVVRVNGLIRGIEQDQKGERVLILEAEDDIFGVVCSIDETNVENRKKSQALKAGDSVMLKGICTGFAEDVKLNKCVLQK